MLARRSLSPSESARRHPRWRRLRRLLFYGVVRGLAGLVRTGPRWGAVCSLRALAALAWWLRPRERAIALRQLERALPALDAQERRVLGRRSLRRLAENLVDALRSDRPLRARDEDEGRLRRRAEEGPLLLLSAHLGCWELLGPFLADRLPALGVVTANPHNDRLDRWLRRERERAGLVSFDRHREVLRAARWLRRGGALVILADHRGRGPTATLSWFGHPAPTTLGPARLARWSGALVQPLGVAREGGAHRLLMGEAILPGVDEPDEALAARMNAALEELILRAPEEWTWIHDRYDEG